MADFCKQCEPESTDLTDITTREEYLEGLAVVVLCEGCGPIQVDPEGNCISKDCLEKHNA